MPTTSQESTSTIATASSDAPALDPKAAIEQAHERSQAFGVAADEAPDYAGLTWTKLNSALEVSKFLLDHALPTMDTLYGQIVNTHSMVVLTSAQGLILRSVGDLDFQEKASQVALIPGVEWSEQTKGTNAIGTALTEQLPITVYGDQHYMTANKVLACSCAPIFDPQGTLVGALDVTGDRRSHHQHTLALVRMSAQMIENHMFESSFPEAVRLHFHARPEFLGTLAEGIAAFTRDGRFISANRSAQFQLGMSLNALRAYTFPSLFDLSISGLYELFATKTGTPWQLCTHNGVTVWCRADIKPAGPWIAPLFAPMQTPQTSSTPAAPERPAAKVRKPPTLDTLDTGDPQVHKIIEKLRKIANHDIPVMILGETGTGKDLLARAIHENSTRARRPFVAVNCASIPDTLIEAELFGYEEGAFTGARKKGSTGKIAQAHGGTLFLDEIGDMPAHLQARLLRMLQERKVSPLGAGKEVDVDIYVVSATHKNLKEMITQGLFREDLYYRLNGMVVRLPALRERNDFTAVVHAVLRALTRDAKPITIARDVLELMTGHHWPGNIRQLHSLLRTAIVMAGDGGCITLDDLSEDFVQELAPQHLGAVAQTTPAPPAFVHADDHASPATAESQRLEDVALHAMIQMLRLHNGNISKAAKALGVSRNTIYRKKHLLPPDLQG